MTITKEWAMPNGKTFTIKPIKELILRYVKEGMTVIDPFANEASIKASLPSCVYISNDLDPNYKCDYSLEAGEFLERFKDQSVDLVLYDPPYSPRQVKEVYTSLERTVTMQDTQSSYWTKFKKEIARVLKPNGICITFGWNTNGIGKINGTEQIEILIVAHGGNRNDTLCVVERKESNENI